jgi:hypothetical protein
VLRPHERLRRRREERRVDAGGDDVDGRQRRRIVEPPERLVVGLGHREHAVEARQGAALEAEHPPPLLAIERLGHGAGGVLGMTPPDLRLDVVGEQDGRARGCPPQVDRGHQEVAHQPIEPAVLEERLERMAVGGRAVLGHGVGLRIHQVPGDAGVEAGAALRRVLPRHVDQLGTDLAHRRSMRGGFRVAGEGEIADLMPLRQVAHEVPGADLAALVERQQEIGVEPENAHQRGACDRVEALGGDQLPVGGAGPAGGHG